MPLPCPSARWHWLLLVALLLAAPGCVFGDPGVPRRVHGRLVGGRFVSESAYALYLEGATAEAQADAARAERLYLLAARQDSESPDIWTRVGAVRCSRAGQGGADQAFAEAARLDPGFGPLYFERARCKLALGDARGARDDAARSLELDPEPEQTSLLLSQIDERLGDLGSALRWLDALAVRAPESLTARRALGRFAQAHALASPGRRAAGSLDPGASRSDGLSAPSAGGAEALLDEALGRGALDEALARADRGGIGTGTLALRAAALGALAIARSEGSLVLGADPSNNDARVALLYAADVLGDEASLEQALGAPPARPRPLSALASCLLADVVLRRAGRAEARRVLALAGAAAPGEEPLLARVRQRVMAAAGP